MTKNGLIIDPQFNETDPKLKYFFFKIWKFGKFQPEIDEINNNKISEAHFIGFVNGDAIVTSQRHSRHPQRQPIDNSTVKSKFNGGNLDLETQQVGTELP